ncbi:hypothetical protein GLV94_01925 [Virgibacillus halodenitrificans]|uniref:hypothetical protein n=1 Tax=Virgibacillus halodenitrificans TaxID=1482 RepID=UPI00136FCD29|nr:hypothetical protein [Virgibacillus halodenitrificans]MYL44392.1 hypothetical protein [Virgibacillus halodenitrificans]
MGKRKIYNSKDIEALLTENSKHVIEEFLTYYAEGSRANMRSSVYRLLYEILSKEEVSDVTYQDYLKLFPNDDRNTNTQEKYRYSFFRFLYAYDYLKVPNGFEKKFIKEREKDGFKKPEVKELRKQKRQKPKNTLTIEELTSIQQIINIESTKLDTLKMQFVWYSVFELGIDIDDVKKKITSDNYENGKLNFEGNSYKLPQKYSGMFDKMSEGDTIYNGFSTINYYFEKLGNMAKLERKLLPVTAKTTRKEYMVSCGNCGNKYTNLANNWLSVNGRIVCVECAEALKKN